MKSDMNSFVIANPAECIGCRACEIACAAKHRESGQGQTIGTMNSEVAPALFLVRDENIVMPVQCRQCEDAPCKNACPVNAIVEKDGTMIVHENKCIGCGTCTIVCPVGTVNLLPRIESEVVTGKIKPKIRLAAYKCNLCKEEGGEPACVKECPKDALKVLDCNENEKDCNIKIALGK
ncbi:4Fe-4S dicluster domain-containing protein [Clostridium sp. WILCCON 0269]|uniref:Ferredoxin n=1 Tax=Candidatus Clostridium eludens TaxID=3381663 RepID=A0ABW8STJ2_9CLOT